MEFFIVLATSSLFTSLIGALIWTREVNAVRRISYIEGFRDGVSNSGDWDVKEVPGGVMLERKKGR